MSEGASLNAQDFFQRLWAPFRRKSDALHVELRYSQERTLTDGQVRSEWGRMSKLPQWLLACSRRTLSTPHSLHFSVCPRTGQDGKKNSVAGASCLWVDIDHFTLDDYRESLQEKLARERIEPSLLMSSGWGIYLFWVFERPVRKLESLERINRFLAWFCHGDLASVDASRMLRFPGSYNCKAVPYRLVSPLAGVEKPYVPEEMSARLLDLFTRCRQESEENRLDLDALMSQRPTRQAAGTPAKPVHPIAPASRIEGILLDGAGDCNLLDAVVNRPQTLSYGAWCSLSASIYRMAGDTPEAREVFHRLSALDRLRYSQADADRLWQNTVEAGLHPYGCGKLSESRGCCRLANGSCHSLDRFVRLSAAKEKKAGKEAPNERGNR